MRPKQSISNDVATPQPTPTSQPHSDPSCFELLARAYAEIVLRVVDALGDVFATIDDPYNSWVMLKTDSGSRQSGIQAVINAELTLARWDGQTPITSFRV